MRLATANDIENADVSTAFDEGKVAETFIATVDSSFDGVGCVESAVATLQVTRVCRRALGDITNFQASQAPAPSACDTIDGSQVASPTCQQSIHIDTEDEESNMFCWREVQAMDDPSVAMVTLGEVINSVALSLCHSGLDSEWTYYLSRKLSEVIHTQSTPSELIGVLMSHSWRRTQFAYPPDRESLLLDLDRLRTRIAVALVSSSDTAVSEQVPIAMPEADMAGSTRSVATRTAAAYDNVQEVGDIDVCRTEMVLPTISEEPASLEVGVLSMFGADASPISAHSNEEVQEPVNEWQCMSEFPSDIVDNMLCCETEQSPPPNYMDTQPDINGSMRAILVDWIVDVMAKFELRCTTLFLAVSLIDRFLSRAIVMRKNLQLVGTAAAMIAAKFEEISPPCAKDFCHVAANICTVAELFAMESEILNIVEFNVAVPTSSFFLDYYCGVNGCDPAHREMVQYVAQLALLNVQALNYKPSHLAAAAVLFGNRLVGWSDAWPRDLATHVPYDEEDLEECTAWLSELLHAAPTWQLQAVCRKFSSEKRYEVALQQMALA